MIWVNLRFYLYSKAIHFFIRRGDFKQVEVFLNKKKELAKILREQIKQKQ